MSSTATKTVTARLPTDLAEWVEREFSYGFKQMFILQCFLSLRHVMTEGELPPFNEYARAASIDAIAEIASGSPRPEGVSQQPG